MQIASIVKDSFQEFDGEHSLVLFTKGCNLDCSFCYNKDSEDIINKDIKDIIDENITPMHTAVVICGGEPTLWAELPFVCKYIKEVLKLKVKLFTNGIYTEFEMYRNFMDSLFYLDFISLDFKCTKNVSEVLGCELNYDDYISEIECRLSEINDMDVYYEIRTTVFDGMSKEELEEIKNIVSKITKNHNDGIYFMGHILQDDFRKFLKK